MQRLEGSVQHYAWGTADAIPELLGREVTGEPHAEYWLGAHHRAPARLGDETLLDAIAADPAILGEHSRVRFGDRLPFLLKVLSAGQALSLQAHPSRAQAEAGFAAEEAAGVGRDAAERNYKDDWPKPEALIARTPFAALCGFRTPGSARAALDVLNAPRELAGLLEGDPAAAIRRAFFAALELNARQVGKVIDTAWAYADAGGEPGLLARTVLHAASTAPGDPSVVATLLLNRVDLAPEQAIFLPAGNVHAYLSGTGIEIMANSDNVLRAGLTPKHIDAAELGRIVDFAPSVPGIMAAVEEAPGLARYPTPAPEFAIWRVADPAGLALPAAESGRIVLVTDGTLTLSGAGELELPAGAAAWLAAGERVVANGTGRAYLAAPGDAATD